MFKAARLIAAKDLRLTLHGQRRMADSPLAQAVLLGLLLIFMFSLAPSLAPQGSPDAEKEIAPALAVILFWMSSLFAQTLIFQRLYALEEDFGCHNGLLTSPIFAQALWLGKTLAGLILLLLAQIILCPAAILLLNQTLPGPSLPAVGGIILADVGLAALGALLGAFPATTRRAAQLSLLGIPLLIPLFIAAVRLCQTALLPPASLPTDILGSLGILAAFDAIAISAALLLFPFVFMDE